MGTATTASLSTGSDWNWFDRVPVNGLPLIDVDSNIDEFYLAVRIAFQPSHTMRNAAVAHLLSAGIRHYLYASSMPYDRVAVAPRFDVSFADPILLPLLSTSSLTLRSSGSDMGRATKVALIAEIPHTYAHLDVCVRSTDGTNCAECPKCQRTMLTLELLGGEGAGNPLRLRVRARARRVGRSASRFAGCAARVRP